MITKGLISSASDEWETPQDLFDELDAEYHFVLDVAASESNHKCAKYYTKAEDGLKQLWKQDGWTWCNPPYGKQIKKWVQKAYEEYLGGAKIVMLLPARTDTMWFHKYIYGIAKIQFLRGRLRFSSSKVNAPFPSMIVVFGEDGDGT